MLENHFQPAGRVVAHFITEHPPDGFGLQPGFRAGPTGVEGHSVEGEPGQGDLGQPFLGRPAGLECRGHPVTEEVPEFILGGGDPHGGAGILGDGPAGTVHHGLGLGALGGALDGDVAHAGVGEVLHHRPDPGRGVRTPAAGQGRGLVHVDMLFTPLPRRPAVGRFARRTEPFDQRMVTRSHTPGRNVIQIPNPPFACSHPRFRRGSQPDCRGYLPSRCCSRSRWLRLRLRRVPLRRITV